jgi:hypothetical protein
MSPKEVLLDVSIFEKRPKPWRKTLASCRFAQVYGTSHGRCLDNYRRTSTLQLYTDIASVSNIQTRFRCTFRVSRRENVFMRNNSDLSEPQHHFYDIKQCMSITFYRYACYHTTHYIEVRKSISEEPTHHVGFLQLFGIPLLRPNCGDTARNKCRPLS